MANPLAGDLKLPGVGSVPKKVVIPLGVGVAAFIGYRIWVGGSSGDEVTETPAYEDGGTIPSLSGPAFAGGGGSTQVSGEDPDVDGMDQYGFTGTTNSQWTQYVAGQLSQGERWAYGDILDAIGSFLSGKPLTKAQQSIVQAGIAVGGNAPVGYHSVIPGGDTPITIAPTGVQVASTTTTTATVTFSPVAGASRYAVYRSGAATNVTQGAGTSLTVSGLRPGTKYSFQVKAISESGKAGPKSASAVGTTKTATMPQAKRPAAGGITKTSATLRTTAVPGADYYRWQLNGQTRGSTDAPIWTATGLTPGKRYTVAVSADTSTGTPGKYSPTVSFTTKKK